MRTTTRLLAAGGALCALAACNTGSPGFSLNRQAQTGDTIVVPANFRDDSLHLPVMLSKEATIKLFVPRIDSTFRMAKVLLAKEGGYYTDWNESRQGDLMDGLLTMRVPSGRFDALADEVASLGATLDISVNTSDLSGNYDAVRANLDYRKRSMARYMALVQRKGKGDGALEALSNIDTLDLGATVGADTLRQMQLRVQMSTIHLELQQLYDNPNDPRDHFAYRWVVTLRAGWVAVQWIVLGLTALWPLVVAGVVLLLLLYRKRRRAGTRPKGT